MKRRITYVRAALRVSELVNQPHILLFDIETLPGIARFWRVWKENINPWQIIHPGCMLSWSAKWLFEPEVFGDIMTSEEALKRDNRRITTSLWNYMEEADIVIAHNGCVTPENRVLKSDLTWCPVGKLKEGDELIAFDEERRDLSNPKDSRRYKLSKVLRAELIYKECSEIKLKDGTKIVASNDHPWLVQRSLHWRYKNTDKLQNFKKQDTMCRIIPTWETVDDYHSGYLSAFLDGEGHICWLKRKQRATDKGWKEYRFIIGLSQKDQIIIDKLKESLDYYKIPYNITENNRNGFNIKRIAIQGKFQDKLKFIGMIQPAKRKKMDLNKIESVELRRYDKIDIESVTPVGIKTVVGLETTSKTYIVEGFPCHNSAFDVHEINTQFLLYGLGQPAPYKIIDTCLVARKYFSFEHNKLDYLAERLGLPRKIETNFSLWVECESGDEKALSEMLTYNKQDVNVLEEVYVKLRPWMKDHPNLALFIDGKNHDPICGHCMHEGLINLGWYYTSVGKYESYRCPNCGAIRRSRVTTATRKTHPHVLQNIS